MHYELKEPHITGADSMRVGNQLCSRDESLLLILYSPHLVYQFLKTKITADSSEALSPKLAAASSPLSI